MDIRLDNGKGDVTYSSSAVHNNINQQFFAVPHANGQDYWILVTEGDSSIHAYRLSASGVAASPVVSDHVLTSKGVWTWDISPDYTKIAVSYFDNTRPSYVKVYNFDNATGLVSNNTLTISITDIFCLQFSPDGSKLYAGQFNAGIVYQWDLNAGSQTAIINSQTTVGFSCVLIACMRTGPDGKIYIVSNAYNNYLHCISNPNAAGSSCGFQLASVSLGRSAWNFLPYFPRDFLTKNGLSTSTRNETAIAPAFDFTVYPNPAQSKIQVSLPASLADGIAKLEVINALGKQVDRRIAFSAEEFDVSDFEPGVYFIIMTSGNNSASKKFIVL